MKKFVTVMLIAVIALSSVFAMDSYVDDYFRHYEVEAIGHNETLMLYTSTLDTFNRVILDYDLVLYKLGFTDAEVAEAEEFLMDEISNYLDYGNSPLLMVNPYGAISDSDAERPIMLCLVPQYTFEEAVLNAVRNSGKFTQYFKLLDSEKLDTTADSKKNEATKLMETVWDEYVMRSHQAARDSDEIVDMYFYKNQIDKHVEAAVRAAEAEARAAEAEAREEEERAAANARMKEAINKYFATTN